MYVSKYVSYAPSMRHSVPRILTGTISANPKILNPISHTSNGSLSPLRDHSDYYDYDYDYHYDYDCDCDNKNYSDINNNNNYNKNNNLL